jgi:hypothetical protein
MIDLRTITRPKLTAGGATTSLLALGFHNRLPSAASKSQHLALGGAHDEHPLIGADASRERCSGLDPPGRLAVVEASDRAVAAAA